MTKIYLLVNSEELLELLVFETPPPPAYAHAGSGVKSSHIDLSA